MGYIITATFETDNPVNRESALEDLLAVPEIRLLTKDDEEGFVKIDIRGDWSKKKEQTLWLSCKLIDAGVLSFQIGHSY